MSGGNDTDNGQGKMQLVKPGVVTRGATLRFRKIEFRDKPGFSPCMTSLCPLKATFRATEGRFERVIQEHRMTADK